MCATGAPKPPSPRHHVPSLRFALAALLVAPTALAQPDLAISATAEDASGEAGGRVSLSYTATLTGAEEIEDVSVGFYFSTDQTLSSDDAFSEREEVDTESDEPESDNEQIDIPASLADGDYFILVVIDDLEQVAESDETNNTVAIPFAVGNGGTGGGGGANLTVTSSSPEPASGAPGTEVEVEYQIGNAGSESSGESQVAFYLSRDRALSTGDTFLTREDVDGVDAGGSTDGDAEFEVPSSLSPGDYFLLAVADDRNAVTETDESDNTRAVPFTVTGGGTGGGDADLRISTASATPTSADAGAEIEVAYVLSNDGTAEAGETQVGVYLSTDRSLSSGDLLVTRADADGVGAGESEDSDEDVTVPNSAAPGDYFLLFEADDRNTVSESDESNNTLALAFTVTGSGGGGDGQADLRVSEASSDPSSGAPGTSVETEFSLQNTGTSQAGGSTVALYLSADRSLSSGDARLGETQVDEVDAGGDGDGEIDFSVPSVAPGSYFLLFAADDGNDVSESRESNNVRAVPFTVLMGTASEDAPTAGLRFKTVAPNPVAQLARVAFSLDAPGPVRLIALDALGREVAVLAEGERASGPHEATWDAGALASGVYVLRLSAGAGAVSQTVTVAR